MSLENFKNNIFSNLSPNLEKQSENPKAIFVSKDTGLTPEELDEKYIIHPKHHALASNITDFVTVIGSAKMIHEAVKGEQMGTEKKLEGWRRIAHGAAGAGFLASDLTGVGAIASIGSKLIGRGALSVTEKLVEKTFLKQIAKKEIIQEGVKLKVSAEKRSEMRENL
jgi:Pre-toxin TG